MGSSGGVVIVGSFNVRATPPFILLLRLWVEAASLAVFISTLES